MNKIFITLLYVLAHCCNIYAQENHVLENKYLKREFSIDKYLHTVSITNKQTQVSQSPFYCEEFSLRFSDGTARPEPILFLLQKILPLNQISITHGKVKIQEKDCNLL